MHMLCHNECISGDAGKAKPHYTRPWDSFLQEWSLLTSLQRLIVEYVALEYDRYDNKHQELWLRNCFPLFRHSANLAVHVSTKGIFSSALCVIHQISNCSLMVEPLVEVFNPEKQVMK